ncbi:hypothetical protein QPL79_03260 [Ignisphaera sp. 4213-co]|uniref:Uncharacterized protein n=1 Tax=Ignisphaera cupida TaxID=3050454 RepID=A0ABD4Z645_9CREN|nr:hypothetical protein [Ignisphaera sp. 4213-co]MDK6028380.1 hypothetical protein [Ignisphaera sp. 4213-co]
MSSKEISREELIDLILANNMLDQFIAWLRLRGLDSDPVSLRDIDLKYLYEFALEKKLLTEDELEQDEKDYNSELEYSIEKKIINVKPRKIRRKT